MDVLLQNVLFKKLYYLYKCLCVFIHILVYNLIITYKCSFVKCFMHLFQIIFLLQEISPRNAFKVLGLHWYSQANKNVLRAVKCRYNGISLCCRDAITSRTTF